MHPEVDTFIAKATQWKAEMTELRRILLDSPLVEEIKWYQPCYTFEGRNVVILSAFKDYVALSFFKGVLIKDPENRLIQPTENMQAGRHLRYTSLDEIKDQEEVIKDYLQRAVEVEKSGEKVEFKKTSEFEVPEELKEVFEQDPAFKIAFEALTPGRQRGYLLYFGRAKQPATRISRIQKHRDRIFEGKGIHDR